MRRIVWLLLLLILMAGCVEEASTPSFPDVDPKDLVPDVPPTTKPVDEEIDNDPVDAPPDWPAFELTFDVGNDGAGRVLWSTSSFYRYDYVLTGPEGPVHQYSFQRWNQMEHVASGAAEESMHDGTVPWGLLTRPRTLEGQWAELGDTEFSPTDPTHHLATTAITDGVTVLELSADMIPVRVAVDGVDTLHATSLELRGPFRGEITRAGQQLSFDWAQYLWPSLDDVLQVALADGLVTAAEYQAAADRVVECVTDAGGQGDWTVDQSSGRIEIASENEAALEECMATHFVALDEVRDLQTRLPDDDEGNYLYAVIWGDTVRQAIYSAEPGPPQTVASGDGWSVVAWERGPGICVETTVADAAGGHQGLDCNVPERWVVPNTGTFSASWRSIRDEGFEPGSGDVIGVTIDAVTAVEVAFTSGTVAVYPTVSQASGLAGYYGIFDPVGDGIPTVVRYLAADGRELGTFDWLAFFCADRYLLEEFDGYCSES